MPFPIFVQILEKSLPWQIFQSGNKPRQSGVGHIQVLFNPMLGPEIKRDMLSMYIHMPVPQGRQAIAPVFARVPVIPDTSHGPFHDEDNRRENTLTIQLLSRQILCNLCSQSRQMFTEHKHSTKLGDVPCFPPSGMITILQPPPGIRAYSLQMTVRVSTDPDVTIRRWNTQTFQTRDDLLIRNTVAGRIVIGKSLTHFSACNSRLSPVNIMQPRAPGLFLL